MPCLAHVAHVPAMGETFPVGVVPNPPFAVGFRDR